MGGIGLPVRAALAALTTLLLLPQEAQAQQRAMVNSSFESNDPQGAGHAQLADIYQRCGAGLGCLHG